MRLPSSSSAGSVRKTAGKRRAGCAPALVMGPGSWRRRMTTRIRRRIWRIRRRRTRRRKRRRKRSRKRMGMI